MHKEDTSKDNTTPISFYNSRRRTGPAKSFAFLSTFRGDHERTLPSPAHVHLHVEVEQDYQSRKSLAEDVGPAVHYKSSDLVGDSKKGIDAMGGQETFELDDMWHKCRETQVSPG